MPLPWDAKFLSQVESWFCQADSQDKLSHILRLQCLGILKINSHLSLLTSYQSLQCLTQFYYLQTNVVLFVQVIDYISSLYFCFK